jgi:hypothetical protein
MKADPVTLSKTAEAAETYRTLVRKVLLKQNIVWKDGSALIMERGCYTVTSVMDEAETSSPYTLKGLYIDMYKTYLDVLENPVLGVGSVGLYYNMEKVDKKQSCEILAAAARIENYKATARSCTFTAVSAAGSECVVRMYVRKVPVSVSAVCEKNEVSISCDYEKKSKTVLLRFANSINGVSVKVKFC